MTAICKHLDPHRHATRHFLQTQHPVIRSLEPGEDWGWCYLDEVFLEPAPAPK